MSDSPQPNLSDPGLVLRSVDVLASKRAEVAAHFYGRLFGRHPELEAYFKGHDTVWRERMFVTALRSMMMAATSPPNFERETAKLAEGHRKHQIQPEHFGLFTNVLLETLAYYAGPKWTPDIAAAWSHVATLTADALATGVAPETGHSSAEHSAA